MGKIKNHRLSSEGIAKRKKLVAVLKTTGGILASIGFLALLISVAILIYEVSILGCVIFVTLLPGVVISLIAEHLEGNL